MKKIKILPYKNGSRSVKLLRSKLKDIMLIKKINTPFRGYKVLVNWGNSNIPQFRLDNVKILNSFTSVKVASNKLLTFIKLKDKVAIPEFTTKKEDTTGWKTIVCRKLLTSSGGKGIVLVNQGEQLVEAPLYVKYYPKKREYRIHVFKGEVIDFAVKRRKNNVECNKYIRSHENGWVFCRRNAEPTEEIKNLAIKAIETLELDFGAVDIIVTPRGKSYVLEVNTAPGLEGTTVESYAAAMRKLIW